MIGGQAYDKSFANYDKDKAFSPHPNIVLEAGSSEKTEFTFTIKLKTPEGKDKSRTMNGANEMDVKKRFIDGGGDPSSVISITKTNVEG